MKVFDTSILGGRSFSPGDVINLAAGEYIDRPLNFCQSGSSEQPIVYRSAPGERAVLISTAFNRAPVRHLANRRSTRTAHVVLEDLTVRNATDGNHGAPGIDLFGVSHFSVRGCNVHISGRDINGDNNAIRLFDADHVTIAGCRLHSRYANGIAAWATADCEVSHTVIYESFHGVIVAGGRYTSELAVRNCTIYATNQHGGILVQKPSHASVTSSIIAQTPSPVLAALGGPGSGDFNCLWNAASGYGIGWNGSTTGRAGPHDTRVDPQFLSLNPASPLFLRFAANSPASTAGENRSYIGAFPPVQKTPTHPATAKFNVQDYGAIGDGVHDDTNAILAAINAARSGGTVVFPKTSSHYLISKTIRVNRDRVKLYGSGATLKLKAKSGRVHMIEVSGDGPTKSIVEHVTIEGLSLDGNYRQQPQQRSGEIPRGVWVENAGRVTLKDLTIRDVYCGASFAKNSRECDAIDITVTDWDHDAYGASGWGQNGGCTDIRFIRCKAVDTSRCVKAWEIEEGAQRVYLEDCQIENLGGTGTGFYVRHHAYRWPLLVDDVTFVRCKATNISGAGFLITTVPGEAIRPAIRTRNVRLINCRSDAPVTIACGVEDVQIQGGRFDATVALGFDAKSGAPVDDAPKWPVRSVLLDNCQIQGVKINARKGNSNGRLGDTRYRDYEPRVRLKAVRVKKPVEIVGNKANVVIEDAVKLE
ncbi:MAG: hypothetical protein CMJ78_15205 [Planctomycetaceae bacterium]|nr:hypothetical protein [Planctomycetaceae bacterium]